MSKHLHISDDLSLPIDAVTQTFGIFGIRGSGKTHTSVVMVEEMLKAGQPVCVYDPVGAWHGIKTSADGKRPGFPVVIFGGERADVPLEKTAGETIARVIVEKRIPAVLDCSLLRKGERTQFMTAFCETLYHLNREPLHFVADEAHTICPLKPLPESARLLGAMEDIVLQGRLRGLGATFISQRPALVHTNIRTQCATLVAMRIIGPHDLKAIKEWTDAHGTPEQSEQLLRSLPTLKTGHGWIWSPSWLDLFKQVKFRQRETFDSSATPKIGEKVVTPKVAAEIDLAALGEQIRATVEKAKENDPALLKKQVMQLRADLAEAAKAPAPKAETKIIEKPVVTDAQVKAIERVAESLKTEGTRRIEQAQKLADSGNALIGKAEDFVTASRRAANQPVAAQRSFLTDRHRPSPAAEVRRIEPRKQPTMPTEGALPSGEKNRANGNRSISKRRDTRTVVHSHGVQAV